MKQRQQNTPLTLAEVLAWADQHFRRTGAYPKSNAGQVVDGPIGTTWRQIDNVLRYGLRCLEGGSSLAQLLDRERSVRNVKNLPLLTEGQIVRWARRHRKAKGSLPVSYSGPVEGQPGEVWFNINAALQGGGRGLPGGSSLAQLLARELGKRVHTDLPTLTEDGILAWADRHHEAHGEWPKVKSGPVDGADGETWGAIDDALRQGLRGLTGGSSLPRLLANHRAAVNPAGKPPLTVEQIQAWATAHFARTGRWPTADGGAVEGTTGETWRGINLALWQGLRGLPGGSSLSKALAPLKDRTS